MKKTKLELKKTTRPLAANELQGLTLYRVKARFLVPQRLAFEGEVISLPEDVASEHMENLEAIDVHGKTVCRLEHVEVPEEEAVIV